MTPVLERFPRFGLPLAAAISMNVFGCVGGAEEKDATVDVGELVVKLVSASPHDVAQVLYRVVPVESDCNGTAVAERTSPLEAETLPSGLQMAGSSASHRFSDALFTLDTGTYRVCAVPQTTEGNPSAVCGPTETLAFVSSSLTAEVVLVSQCNGNQKGGLDAVVVLNDPPVIDTLDIQPSKFITTCETATLNVSASDPDGDVITSVTWISLTPGATLTTSGTSASFSATTAGDYQVQVVAIDANGGQGSLIVPIHVTGADCGGCQSTRPNVLLCGASQRPIAEFVPAGFAIVESCTPDANTQAMFITRHGGGDFNPVLFDPATIRSYVEAGGIVLTEWSNSALVFNSVFDEVVALGSFQGACSDNVNPLVRHNLGDDFWVANGSLPAPMDQGCGYDMSAFPGITSLGGWSADTVQLAYRSQGDGRVWFIESDWQDYEPGHENDPTMNQMMHYMVQNGGATECDVPPACTGGVDPVTAAPWVVCAADADTAWVSADNFGTYHVDSICQSLGYSAASQFGGTCGNVCGYCEEPTSCGTPGARVFDGSGNCGVDEFGLQVCFTVMWECVR